MKKAILTKTKGQLQLIGTATDKKEVYNMLKNAGYHLNQQHCNTEGYNLSDFIAEKLQETDIRTAAKPLISNSGNPFLFIVNEIIINEIEGGTLERYQAAIDEMFAKYNAYKGFEKQKAAEQRAAYVERKTKELSEPAKGWYVVELPCYELDFRKGGHRERWTNWKVLADSPINAYNLAVTSAEEKGYFWFRPAVDCQIEFYGVWTDEKEDMLREEGLI